jgi:hypothetical protein
MWLKILGTIGKKNFIVIILVKQQTLYEIITRAVKMGRAIGPDQ